MEAVNKILLVDDVDMNLVILSQIVDEMNFVPLCASSATEALEVLRNDLPQLILLDISMPDMSGVELCKLLKKDVFTRDIPVIFISAIDSYDQMAAALEAGGVDYIRKPFTPENVKMRITIHIKMRNMQKEVEDVNKKLNQVIKKQMEVSRNRDRIFAIGFENMVMKKDVISKHILGSESGIARIITQAMQFSDVFEEDITESFIQDMEAAATMHDAGLFMIPESIMTSKELTAEERKLIERHVFWVDEYLDIVKLHNNEFNDDYYDILSQVVKYHHERYDGSGYPHGLKGKEIPLAARIMAVVDVYEALVNDRVYRKALPVEEAIKFMVDGKNTLFDPDIVDILVKIHKRFEK